MRPASYSAFMKRKRKVALMALCIMLLGAGAALGIVAFMAWLTFTGLVSTISAMTGAAL
ncbi:hypothetical protein [Devosia sp.]|uniref:hypothetical protein n=1 Tax=Devosia sp. TaxID=1871048 RepID=UPI001AD282BC|nr:hypothetical protein [Devosia sp.]MBN9335379.1 hypothetical protein [Devosia sp.]